MSPRAFHVAAGAMTAFTVLPGRCRRALPPWRHGAMLGHIARQYAAPHDSCAAARARDTSRIDRDDCCGARPAWHIWALLQILLPRSRSDHRAGAPHFNHGFGWIAGSASTYRRSRPQGRGCGVRVSRHAVRQNESPRREPCDRHARLSMLRRCYRQAVSSFDLAHLAGTVAGDRAGVRPGTLAIWSERGRFEKGTRFKFFDEGKS